jgi:hypothetical protein
LPFYRLDEGASLEPIKQTFFFAAVKTMTPAAFFARL